MIRQNKKRTIDDEEDRGRKRQRRGEEPSAVQFAPPATQEHLHMAVDTPNISHGTAPPVIPNSPRIGTAPASTDHLVQIPAANAAPISDPASHSWATAILSKRPYPFSGDGARKKKKTGEYINVRIYAERKDLEHTHEIQCALMPDGGLDLVSLSQKMNLTAYQASRLDVIPIGSAHHLPKVVDPRYSRPWAHEHPVLEKGAVTLLKAKDGYLRVVGQAPPLVKGQEPSRFPSRQS